MKTLARKLTLLLAPFVLASLALLTYSSWSPKARQGIFDPQLERKLRLCVLDGTAVIVAGDSRAETQVVPEIIERRTGLPTANVATPAGDLPTLSRAIGQYGVLGRARALILSTSIFQINDAVTAPGYLSAACLLDMTLMEKLLVYRRAPGRLLVTLATLAAEPDRGTKAAPTAGADGPCLWKGFVGLEGTLRLPINISLDPHTTEHSWYRDQHLHGARWRVFHAALDRIAASNVRVFLIQAPVSPAWRAYTTGTFVDRAEREFATMLAEAARRHGNVRFLDFYSQPDARLENGMFYDIQHLNASGAVLFTEILVDRIGDDLRAPVSGERHAVGGG